eukprot:5607681-Pleurochrysis_carterae.AAC.1
MARSFDPSCLSSSTLEDASRAEEHSSPAPTRHNKTQCRQDKVESMTGYSSRLLVLANYILHGELSSEEPTAHTAVNACL